jgi:heme O synthase-like polyprenyltransferase
MVILGVWQLPHYWLILMAHKNDYQNAATPSMGCFFPKKKKNNPMAFVVLNLAMGLFMTVLMMDRPFGA